MGRVLLLALLLAAAQAADRTYELNGRIHPETKASVTLYGATTPFTASTVADSRGRFRFRRLLAGSYSVAVYVPGRGEARQTIDVGPKEADAKGRISLELNLEDSRLFSQEALKRRKLVSASELRIPGQAWREYEEAQKRLSRRDVPGAVARLERAVQMAPQFSAAWNNLGTIAYQSRQFERAEECFRKALEQDPGAFEPLVNLGGVLLTLGKLGEALKFNTYAVVSRANDALANSQLGMNYFALGHLDLAVKYLTIAKGLDPGHFSHPQLTLAEVYLRRKEPRAAADELEDFLRHHPDWPRAAEMRQGIAKLRQ